MVKVSPKNREAWTDYAETLFEAGQLEEALEAFSQSLKLKPDCAKTYFHRAIAQLALGQSDESIQSLKMAFHLDPKQKEGFPQAYPELYRDQRIRRMLDLDQ